MRSLQLFLLIFSFGLLGGCGSDNKKNDEATAAAVHVVRDPNNYRSDCRRLKEKAMHMDSILLMQMETNDTLAAKAIKTFVDFAYYCHDDTLGPVYLIKTAQVARAVGNLPQAEQALKYCIEEHTDFRDRPAAIFLLGQLYDEKSFMQDREKAETLYQQIIDEYPRSEWAVSARGALTMVGKTDEEIIRMLKQKNK